MNEEPLDQTNVPEPGETEILVNEYGETRDSTVVIDEPGRTVLLTDDETIIIDKEPRIDIVPANRPRKVYTGMWGEVELMTVAFAMLAVLTVVLVYIFLVLPTIRELEQNRAERDRIERDLISAREKYGSITDTETHVAQLMTSVDDFESRYLPVASNGRTSLYQRVNALISGYGLINTSGPDYTPLETLEQNDGVQSDQERGRSKYRSIFPGVYVTMTVEGSYQNIRRFIREVETGNDFVVVSAVELEPSDAEKPPAQQTNQTQLAAPFNPNNQTAITPSQSSQPARPRGKTQGEVVSLRLEMAAYFRRPNVVPQITAPTEQ
ncbi:MAG: hypothetical protein H0U23_01025 [Blastocatellia bacterium]|nr:hypothetical protein [Blastocatellia bacterium]